MQGPPGSHPARTRRLLGKTALAMLWPAAAQPTQLRSASIRIVTGEDGKSAGTRLAVTVGDGRGPFLRLQLEDGKELGANEVLDLPLKIVRSVSKPRVRGGRIIFRMDANGDDLWDVRDAQLRATYSDGSTDAWRWGPFLLHSTDSNPFAVEFRLEGERWR